MGKLASSLPKYAITSKLMVGPKREIDMEILRECVMSKSKGGGRRESGREGERERGREGGKGEGEEGRKGREERVGERRKEGGEKEQERGEKREMKGGVSNNRRLYSHGLHPQSHEQYRSSLPTQPHSPSLHHPPHSTSLNSQHM